MSADLLRQATEADAEADRIFEALSREAEAEFVRCPTAWIGGRPLLPAGGAARSQHASDLRRKAERLRAKASEEAQAVIRRVAASRTAPAPAPTAKDSADKLVADILAAACGQT